MGEIKKTPVVKLFIGFIFKEEQVYNKAKAVLENKFGKADFESRIINFTHTNYYENELGSNLKKRFISFKKLIPADKLARIKVFTNKLEKKFSKNAKRLINIDPGYIDLPKVVLASAKDFSHRIYLEKGIFAEITLLYQNSAFRHLDWTFPDFRTQTYFQILNQIREIFQKQLKDE
ncbi:MAG: DUF4416 family protein [Candidatus Omnitrophica bacterium]|nr:DUF4416 family protein [Candidatus Omnitrophota bacterium]